MAAAGVGHGVTTPQTSPQIGEQAIIPVLEKPVLLEMIVPGAIGNEVDVKNPPNFEELNKANPLPPLRRLSKRQTGVDPECNPTKKNKKEEEQATSPFILDPDFASDDDSSDDDFELVPRPKKVAATTTQEGTSQSVEEVDPELDISLASFLMELKKGNAKVTTAEETASQGEKGPDKEMEEEFALNKPQESSDGSDSSSSSTSEFNDLQTASESDSSLLHSESNVLATAVRSSVEPGVDNTRINTIAYDLKLAFQANFMLKSHQISGIYTLRGSFLMKETLIWKVLNGRI